MTGFEKKLQGLIEDSDRLFKLSNALSKKGEALMLVSVKSEICGVNVLAKRIKEKLEEI
ncbi:MAG: hypothetical protein ACYSW6_08610 [Planctomycetota bacterium]|jgi:hypothetical protein